MGYLEVSSRFPSLLARCWGAEPAAELISVACSALQSSQSILQRVTAADDKLLFSEGEELCDFGETACGNCGRLHTSRRFDRRPPRGAMTFRPAALLAHKESGWQSNRGSYCEQMGPFLGSLVLYSDCPQLCSVKSIDASWTGDNSGKRAVAILIYWMLI